MVLHGFPDVSVVSSLADVLGVSERMLLTGDSTQNIQEVGNMKKIKERTDPWQSGISKNITFIVTKDCQLACKYCYLVGKNAKERMSWGVAKKAIDYILSHEEDYHEESVVWDFIGGEPFLEIDLIDKICDYLKMEMFRLNHHWFNSYRFSFSTNGINYHSEKVQKFIEKNKNSNNRKHRF
mgnify:CR=1 FL=1